MGMFAIIDANLFPAIWDDPETFSRPEMDGWESDYVYGIFEAQDSLGALDAYAEREGFSPYSDPDNADAWYIRDWAQDGTTLGAIFCNSEIAVYPLTLFSER